MGYSVDLRDYYENRNAAKAITSDNPHSRALVKIIQRALDLRSTDSVLDVGSSDGYILERLMDAVDYRKGVGIDISEHSIELARSIVRNPRLSFVQGYADRLPFEDESFDKIVCNEVIEHVPDDKGTLKELSRVCKRGGLIYITAPNSFEDMLPLFVRHCRKVDLKEGHLRRYSAAQLGQLAESCGLKVIHLQYNAFIASYFWYSLVVYNAPLKEWLMRFVVTRRSAPTVTGTQPTEQMRPTFGMLAKIGFLAMQMVSALDRPFRNSTKNMGFYAVLRKA